MAGISGFDGRSLTGSVNPFDAITKGSNAFESIATARKNQELRTADTEMRKGLQGFAGGGGGAPGGGDPTAAGGGGGGDPAAAGGGGGGGAGGISNQGILNPEFMQMLMSSPEGLAQLPTIQKAVGDQYSAQLTEHKRILEKNALRLDTIGQASHDIALQDATIQGMIAEAAEEGDMDTAQALQDMLGMGIDERTVAIQEARAEALGLEGELDYRQDQVTNAIEASKAGTNRALAGIQQAEHERKVAADAQGVVEFDKTLEHKQDQLANDERKVDETIAKREQDTKEWEALPEENKEKAAQDIVKPEVQKANEVLVQAGNMRDNIDQVTDLMISMQNVNLDDPSQTREGVQASLVSAADKLDPVLGVALGKAFKTGNAPEIQRIQALTAGQLIREMEAMERPSDRDLGVAWDRVIGIKNAGTVGTSLAMAEDSRALLDKATGRASAITDAWEGEGTLEERGQAGPGRRVMNVIREQDDTYKAEKAAKKEQQAGQLEKIRSSISDIESNATLTPQQKKNMVRGLKQLGVNSGLNLADLKK